MEKDKVQEAVWAINRCIPYPTDETRNDPKVAALIKARDAIYTIFIALSGDPELEAFIAAEEEIERKLRERG